jgi:hypothetical protein
MDHCRGIILAEGGWRESGLQVCGVDNLLKRDARSVRYYCSITERKSKARESIEAISMQSIITVVN